LHEVREDTGSAVELGRENIPRGKTVFVALIKWPRAPNKVAEDQKGADSCWLFGLTAEDSRVEGLRGPLASGAGGGFIVVARRVGTQVALARPHLVDATRIEFVKPHERMRTERRFVVVP